MYGPRSEKPFLFFSPFAAAAASASYSSVSMKRRCLSLQPFHIPTSCRQPRSQMSSRPRPPRGCKEACPSAMSTSDDATHNPVSIQVEEDSFADQCSISLDAGEGTTLPPAEVESAAKDSLSATYNSGCRDHHSMGCFSSNLTAEPLSATPTKSMLKVTASPSSQIAPGSMVWAQTGYREWWPAEVINRQADCEHVNDECDERLVLIQLHGVYEYAWIDPVSNLSQFDHCYEERSKDTSIASQDAPSQASRRKETASFCEHSDEKSVKWNMVSCCSTNNDPIDEGKGKRKRKPKVHFDDLEFPDNSVRKMRRMKIMRYLGLTAPVGSPFSRPPVRRRS